MTRFPRFRGNPWRVAALFVLTATSGLAATLNQQIEPAEVNVGDQISVTITVADGAIKKKETSSIFGMLMPSVDFTLPPVDGVQEILSSLQSISVNGNTQTKVLFTLIPARSGDFTIPAFDIPLQDGTALHVKAMSFHVLGNVTAPATNNAGAPALITVPLPGSTTNAPFNPHGPVVMPSSNGVAPATADNGNPANAVAATPGVPRDKDGGPAKVFIIITPQTTDAYVGQSIPLRIDFYIRLDVNAPQNSLPTIKGSDFLMNNFTTRGHGRLIVVEGQQYGCETWITAISAPKSGDLPLSMERDTYWIKSLVSNNNLSFFGGFFNRHENLAHEMITSNQMTIHVQALPEEGRPDHFTGAIGEFRITGEAQPPSVAVGEPVSLHFTVSGEGNFDYVRCPFVAEDPAWKTYVPSSKISYLEESRTHAVKSFTQAIIPQKNGTVPLPAATFSYFDPALKQYTTVPIPLPGITVTGSPVPAASSATASGADTTSIPNPAQAATMLPNRLEIGSLQTNLLPVYRQPWFWAIQAVLVLLPVVGVLVLVWRHRSRPTDDQAECAQRRRSLQQEEDAMAQAVGQNDAVAFFLAARHAIQLQLGAQWNVSPEALTLGEIRSRDAQLAETLEPLFTQADEVIYSGHASAGLDLAGWERRVRTELLQPQPA